MSSQDTNKTENKTKDVGANMQSIWIVMEVIHYEGSEVVSVHITKEGAMEEALKLVRKQEDMYGRNTGKSTKDTRDGYIGWTFKGTTIEINKHVVNK